MTRFAKRHWIYQSPLSQQREIPLRFYIFSHQAMKEYAVFQDNCNLVFFGNNRLGIATRKSAEEIGL